MRHFPAGFLHVARDFVPESQRQRTNSRNTGAIMRIRVTDAGSRNANQNVERCELGNWNVRLLERFSELHESHRSHCPSVATALPSSFKKSAIYLFSVTRVTV